MKGPDIGNYYYVANPIHVDSVKGACDALRDSLAGEFLKPQDIEAIINRFKTRIREVKTHG